VTPHDVISLPFLSNRIHFDHDVVINVGDPEIVGGVDTDAVRTVGQSLAEPTNEGAVTVELEQRSGRAMEHEHMVFRVDCHVGDRSQLHVRR